MLVALARLQESSLPHFDIKHCSRRGWLGDAAVEAVHGYVYPQELLKLSREAAEKLARGELEVPDGYPTGDLYLGPASLDALNGCLGATYDGIDAIFGPGSSYDRCHVCIRPPGHHAAEIAPSGFCWLNNVHIAIAYAREQYGVRRAVILDFDLHHGDGSQELAWKLNEAAPDSIGYYSIHDIRSFPCEMGDISKIREASVSISAHGHNIHNVHIEPWASEVDFQEIYKRSYSTLFDKAAAFLAPAAQRSEPTLVCISAGYDASEHETPNMQRHVANVPTSFYQQFTEDAVNLAKRYANGKILSVMEGGYGDRAIISAAGSHLLGLADTPPTANRAEMQSWFSLENLSLIEKTFPRKHRARKTAVANVPWLTATEALVAQHLPSPAAEESPQKSDLALDLGKMTLRARVARSTPISSPAKTSRSTVRRTAPDGDTPSKSASMPGQSVLASNGTPEAAQLPIVHDASPVPLKQSQPPTSMYPPTSASFDIYDFAVSPAKSQPQDHP
jgi:histone deacetylase HOS3